MFFNSLAGSSALSTIQISRQHPLGLAAARLAAEAIAADMSESYQLDCEWADEEETELRFRGSGYMALSPWTKIPWNWKCILV